MSRKTICLVTTWYPTKENPYSGIFFKEQAFATAEYYDYIVVHYKEKKCNLPIMAFIKKIIGKDYSISKTNEENNTIEFDLQVEYSVYVSIFNALANVYSKIKKKFNKVGVGKIISCYYKSSKKEKITRIFRKHFEGKIDILYCVDAQTESSTLQIISEALNIPYIVSEHAPLPWPGSVINDFEHEAMEKADVFLAISYDKIRQTLLQNIKPRKIYYIGNMIDEDQFILKSGDNKIKKFIIVAAHSFYKNYDLFIKVMNRLTEITKVPFKVMIVGYGANKGYSTGIAEFETQIKNSKFAENAIMIEEVAHKEIHKLYCEADAFIMTSIQEGQPVSAMEAACCGLPIFSTRCGGVEDYVDDEIGCIFQMNDVETFAQTLNEYLEGKIVFDAVRIREKVINKFGKSSFVENFKRIFDEVMDSYYENR